MTDIKKRFLGGWELVKTELYDTNDNPLVDPLSDAKGTILYCDNYTMSAQIMRSDYLSFYQKDANYDSTNNFFEAYLAYFGKYTINPDNQTITHYVWGSSIPSINNKDLVRTYRFVDEKTLILKTAQPETISDKPKMIRQLTWRKI